MTCADQGQIYADQIRFMPTTFILPCLLLLFNAQAYFKTFHIYTFAIVNVSITQQSNRKMFTFFNILDEILTGGSGGDKSEVEQVTGFLG